MDGLFYLDLFLSGLLLTSYFVHLHTAGCPGRTLLLNNFKFKE